MTDRKDSLVRAAKVRAAIIARLPNDEGAWTPDDFKDLAEEEGQDVPWISSLMERMAISGLIRKIPVTHDRYKFGYVCGEGVPVSDAVESFAKRTYNKKQTTELPLDIRINEKDQTLTIRAMGPRITIGKE